MDGSQAAPVDDAGPEMSAEQDLVGSSVAAMAPNRNDRHGQGNPEGIEHVLQEVDRLGLNYVRCQFIDSIGVGRGRMVRREYLPRVMDKGLPFAQVNITVDIDDAESDLSYGSQAGDFWAVPDPSSFTVLPYATATGHMFTDLVAQDGTPWPTCPRTALQRLTAAVEEEIGTVRLGFEQEGYLLRKEGDAYFPVHRGKQFTAELLDAEDGFIADLGEALVTMGVPLEKMTAEGGLGMFEVNFGAALPVPSAEQYFRFKHAFRAIARRHGHVGSFMPKPFPDAAGAGLHVHISLVDRSTESDLFAGPSTSYGLSKTAYHFIGGLVAHSMAITALGSPSVNSYKRLQPGTWSPTHATYGIGNRSAMVRVVESRTDVNRPAVQRLEVRSPDGTCNPYLLAGVLVAAGLDGVRRRIDPGPPIAADIARLTDAELATQGIQPLPRTLDRALDGLEADTVIRELMGPAVVDAFIKAKRIEWEKFSRHITDWEYRYYPEFY